MLKKILLFSIFSISLYAFNPDNYSYMISNHIDSNGTAKNIDKLKNKFESINNNVNYDFASDFKKKYANKFQGLSYEQAKKYINDFYRKNDFLTKEESLILLDYVFKVRNSNTKYANNFILYFFTESVPKNSMANILLGVSALQEEGIDISIKEYMTGPSDNLKEYLFGWNDFIEKYPLKYQKNISDNFHLKFDPRFFKVYNVKKAPAMAFAHCQSMLPTPKTCKVDFLIRGDTSLITFFDKISKIDKKYLPYKKILEAKNIYEVKK